MKIRDLGKAILDFELGSVPKAIFMAFILILGFIYSVFHWLVKTYKSLWWVILLACTGIFIYYLEKDCVNYCYGLVDLYDGYAIQEEGLILIAMLLSGLIISVYLSKKLRSFDFGN